MGMKDSLVDNEKVFTGGQIQFRLIFGTDHSRTRKFEVVSNKILVLL